MLLVSETKMVCLVFGRIYGPPICLRFYLTFNYFEIPESENSEIVENHENLKDLKDHDDDGPENMKKSEKEEENKDLKEDLEHPEFNENVDPKKLVELLFGISQEDTEEFATKKGYDSIADEDEVIEELLNETAKGGLISESFSIRLKSPKNYPKALF